jgi:Short tail fibre protein receptor-binding domain
MANKKITDLTYYSASQYQANDLLFITDIAHQETKKTTAADIAGYAALSASKFSNTGSFTGSFVGNLYGLASVAGNLTYPNTSTSSYAISASYSKNSTTASYAISASYAMNAGGAGGLALTENISQSNHGFSVGDALFIQMVNTVNGLTRNFTLASSTYSSPGLGITNINEVVGLVQSVIDSNNFVVAYGGIVNFASIPNYLNPNYYGYAYFLSGSQGKLNVIDPTSPISNLPLSIRQTQISKPILIQIGSASAVILNQRGMYDQTAGTPLTASFVYYDGNTNNGTIFNAITASYALNAITASYALNGGGGGGGTITNTITNNISQSYYFDTVSIGTVVTCISGNNPPNGWLLCDGGYYQLRDANGNTTTYTELYNAIANNNASTATYGKTYSYTPPNGNIAGYYTLDPNGRFFNIPDLRGLFVRGYNNGLSGSNFGPVSSYDSSNRILGDLQQNSVSPHKHIDAFGNAYTDDMFGHSSTAGYFGSGGGEDHDNRLYYTNDGTPYNSENPNPNGIIQNETRPVNIALNYYIKYTKYNTATPDINNLTTGNYPLGGDVGGTLGKSYINNLQGNKINAVNPPSGALLQYDGTAWSLTNITKLFSTIYRSGNVIVNASSTAPITFNSALPSNNYSVTISWNGPNGLANCYISGALSATGFAIANGGAIQQTVYWIAIMNS